MNRIVTLLLVGSSLLLATALTACGDDEQQASSDAPAAAETATETPTPDATEAAGDDDWPESGAKPAESAQTPEPDGAKAASGEAVEIKGFAFAPKDVTVEVGQKITWTNADAAPHTATAKSGDTFDSGTLAKGASFDFEATKAGTVEYFCAIHPSMTATITVQ